MGSIYVLIFSIIVYLMAVRSSSGKNFKPFVAALIVVFLPFIFAKVLFYIYLVGTNLPLFQLISWTDIATLFSQVGLAYGIFYMLQRFEDALGSWFFWSATGLIGIYFVMPYVIDMIVPV